MNKDQEQQQPQTVAVDINGVMETLKAQRNAALDQASMMGGQLFLLSQQLAAMTADCDALRAKLGAKPEA